MYSFTCNVCGSSTAYDDIAYFGRESGHCRHCGSTVRLRAVVRLLSIGLFGKAMEIAQFPLRLDIKGWGLSDWEGYAAPLAARLGYLNTYFHKAPILDISDPPLEAHESLDFVVSSDVLEHVVPPVQAAFDGIASLVKPGGLVVLTVPYSPYIQRTTEHFPQLHEYSIVQSASGPALVNRTRGGGVETFPDLVFHGGEGATLEMRVFALPDLLAHLGKAGLEARVAAEDDLDWGIHWAKPWSLPIVARKVAATL